MREKICCMPIDILSPVVDNSLQSVGLRLQFLSTGQRSMENSEALEHDAGTLLTARS